MHSNVNAPELTPTYIGTAHIVISACETDVGETSLRFMSILPCEHICAVFLSIKRDGKRQAFCLFFINSAETFSIVSVRSSTFSCLA